jgi:hypothetical protein
MENDNKNTGFRTKPSFHEIAAKPNKLIDYVTLSGGPKNFGFKKVVKPTQDERLKNKILNESLAQLISLHEHFQAKRDHRQSVRDLNEAKRLKNQNLYAHEYERIKNYLDTTVIDPVETKRLEDRKKELMAMASERKKNNI